VAKNTKQLLFWFLFSDVLSEEWRDYVVALFMLTQHAVNFARCGVQTKIP